MSELIDSSLLSINAETSLISIHRLIQAAYWDRIGDIDRQEHFATALHLIKTEFRRRTHVRQAS